MRKARSGGDDFFLELLLLLIVLWYVEIELELPLQRRNGGVDVSRKGGVRWSWSREFVEHHANAHEDAPELRLDMQNPSWTRTRHCREALSAVCRAFDVLQ